MFFDPISGWLVALIADGVVISGSCGKTEEVNKKYNRQANEQLNNAIRRVKRDYGFSESAYNQLKFHVEYTRRMLSYSPNARVAIDLDNQEYIIELLDVWEKHYRQYEDSRNRDFGKECHQNAEWFKAAAASARAGKERYVKQLAEAEKEKEKEQTMSTIYFVVGFVLLIFMAIGVLSCFT